MSKLDIVLCLLLFGLIPMVGQNCDAELKSDTMYVPKDQKVVSGEYVETTLKNLSTVRLFKANDNKFYMKMVVTEDFYFDKVDMLEIKSGSKSYYAKDTRQYKINKTRGMYLIEISKNYIATLKEDGITSIVFNHAETDFTRQDAGLIKKMARCMYDIVFVKK